MGAMGCHRTAGGWLWGFEMEGDDGEEEQDVGAVQDPGADEDWELGFEKRGRKRKQRPRSSSAPCKRRRVAATSSPDDSSSASTSASGPPPSWDAVPRRPRSGVAAKQGGGRQRNNNSNTPSASATETDAAAAAAASTSGRKRVGRACHQCGAVKGRTVKCGRCGDKIYCTFCVHKQYPDLSVAEVRAECPCCRGTCSCKRCIPKEVEQSEPQHCAAVSLQTKQSEPEVMILWLGGLFSSASENTAAVQLDIQNFVSEFHRAQL